VDPDSSTERKVEAELPDSKPKAAKETQPQKGLPTRSDTVPKEENTGQRTSPQKKSNQAEKQEDKQPKVKTEPTAAPPVAVTKVEPSHKPRSTNNNKKHSGGTLVYKPKQVQLKTGYSPPTRKVPSGHDKLEVKQRKEENRNTSPVRNPKGRKSRSEKRKAKKEKE
jgi:hypothetical protein